MGFAMAVLPPDDDDDVMDSAETARMLGFKRRTIERWAREGLLPATRVGSKWRFSRRQIRRYFKMREWDEAHRDDEDGEAS